MALVRFVPAGERLSNRSPSSAGEHPYAIHSRNDPTRAEYPYQYREDVAPRAAALLDRNLGTAPVEEKTDYAKWLALGLAAIGVTVSAVALMRKSDAPAQQSSPSVVVIPQGGSMTTETKQVEEKKPKRRTRRTTQARDADGHFLPAGTRAKAKVEGV